MTDRIYDNWNTYTFLFYALGVARTAKSWKAVDLESAEAEAQDFADWLAYDEFKLCERAVPVNLPDSGI